MNITKVFEVLSKHIIELEEKLHFKDIEIESLKRKIERIEEVREYEKNIDRG